MTPDHGKMHPLVVMPFDPNLPTFDKRAMAVCIVIVVLLIVGIWLVHSHVIVGYEHPSQPFAPPNPK